MTRAAKIGMLYPAEREVYKLRRVIPNTPWIACKRCGAPAMSNAVTYMVRDRGTNRRNSFEDAIHTRCVPSGDAPIGIKARSLRASQVRA